MLENAPLEVAPSYSRSIRQTHEVWHDFYGDHPADLQLVSADAIRFRACSEKVLRPTKVPFDRDTQLYNVISIAAALPSKIVEAFLDLCYGRIVNRTGQLDEADLNLLIRSLGRIGCPSLREDLVDLGTGFGDSLLRALFYVAETENDPILAGRVLEKLTSRLPPNRRSWRRSVASVCDNRASQWRLSLIQWLFDNTKHIESPVHDDDPGAAKSAQLSKRWVDFLHFLNAYFRESLDDHPRIDTEAQTATSSRQPSGGERSRPSSVLSEIPPNKVPRYR